MSGKVNRDRGFGRLLATKVESDIDKTALIEQQGPANSEMKKAARRSKDRGFGHLLEEVPDDGQGPYRPSTAPRM